MQLQLTSKTLPYDMGNAGDLIKHGLLAEYTQWWCMHYGEMIFIDPFGGRPWQEPTNNEVSKRILKLKDTALSKAQMEPKSRYFGSGFVVKNTAINQNCDTNILVSDRDSDALNDLVSVGFEQFRDNSFEKENAFSILDCKETNLNASLILLDPFAEFIHEAEKEYSRIANFIEETSTPIALYLLSDDNSESKYLELRKKFFDTKFTQLSIIFPPIFKSSVKGESKYTSEILLLLPRHRFQKTINLLKIRLDKFTKKLSMVLAADVIFSSL